MFGKTSNIVNSVEAEFLNNILYIYSFQEPLFGLYAAFLHPQTAEFDLGNVAVFVYSGF